MTILSNIGLQVSTTEDIKVMEVKSRKDWNVFFDVAIAIHQGDPNWVCPLRTSFFDVLNVKKNPFWAKKRMLPVVVYYKDKPAGRAVFFENKDYNTYNNVHAGFFGFFECIHHRATADALFDVGENWLRSFGYDKVIGPFNPSLNYELGILTKGFDAPPFVMMTHNAPYYMSLLADNGYYKARDFKSYIIQSESISVANPYSDRHRENLIKWSSFKLRPVNIEDFPNEIKLLHGIYNDGFAAHWGYSPMSLDEFQFIGKSLVNIIDPDLFLIAECDNEPAGFVMCMPNINELLKKVPNGRLFPFGLYQLLFRRNTIKSVRASTMVMRKKFQHLGLSGMMYASLVKTIIAKKYTSAEISWVIEENEIMHHVADWANGAPYKTYRVYQKDL